MRVTSGYEVHFREKASPQGLKMLMKIENQKVRGVFFLLEKKEKGYFRYAVR